VTKQKIGSLVFLVSLSISRTLHSATEAHAGHGAHAGPGLDFLFTVANFVIFALLLFFLLRKPIRDFFASRSSGLRVAVEEAKAAHAKVLQENQEIKARLQRIEQETGALLNSFREAGTLEQNKIISQANEYAARIREDAKRIAESEFKKAKEQLKETTVLLAKELAEKTIRREIDETDEDRLTESYLRRLKSLH
jgi:F-type H+-transporting ATPase subunit b